MNEYDRRLMEAPSLEDEYGRCVLCGRPAQSRHHIVRRSRGGTDGPTALVCGTGNESGCHRRLDAHIVYLDWRGGSWWYRDFGKPVKVDAAMDADGWRELPEGHGRIYAWKRRS